MSVLYFIVVARKLSRNKQVSSSSLFFVGPVLPPADQSRPGISAVFPSEHIPSVCLVAPSELTRNLGLRSDRKTQREKKEKKTVHI